jgi:hypothetical protein
LIASEIESQNLILARERVVPDSVRLFVEELADEVAGTTLDAALLTDPYLMVALQRSLIAALRAVEHPDPERARRELRIRLEQLRHVYRDLSDTLPVDETRPINDLARWLASSLDVSQSSMASVLGVSSRTFQRWVSESNAATPGEDDAARIRIVASLVSHLRHAFTGPGVVRWFDRPHPAIGGLAPKELLNESDALPRLLRLAASSRSGVAS